MFYVSRGSIPPTATPSTAGPTASCTPRSCSASRGSPVAARCSTTSCRRRAPPASSPSAGSTIETADDDAHHHQLIETGAARADGRRDHRPNPAVPQRRRRAGRGPARRPDAARTRSTATARATRCCTSTRARASAHELRRPRVPPGRLPRAADRDDLAPRPGRGVDQRMLYLECPSEIEPPKRYRNDYGQLLEHTPYSPARHPDPGRGPRRATDEGDFTVIVRARRPAHGLPLRDAPVRRRGLGRLPVAVRVRHRGLPADHRPRPPAAARAPDVPGAELRRVLVRAPQVRLPPARDPGAVQPLEHQLATRSSTTSPATS